MEDKLTAGLEKLRFAEEEIPSLATKLNSYIGELELFNGAHNLVKAKNRDEIVAAHVLDSLAGAEQIKKLLPANKSERVPVVADIGSGAGLPGLPLAVALPHVNFVLVERMAKRCAFLQNCLAVLRLSNVSVVNSELEKMPAEQFDVTAFRAFRPLDAHFAAELLRVTKTGGHLAAYKAKKNAILEEMAAVSSLVATYEVLPLEVPFLEERERHLVVAPKTKAGAF